MFQLRSANRQSITYESKCKVVAEDFFMSIIKFLNARQIYLQSNLFPNINMLFLVI